MHKLLIFAKRRAGMSRAEFRNYYENHHVPLCMNYNKGLARYVRRYLEPTPGIPEPDYDVITELWIESRAHVDMILAAMAGNQMPSDVIADEAKLFDRAAFRFYVVSEAETDVTGAG